MVTIDWLLPLKKSKQYYTASFKIFKQKKLTEKQTALQSLEVASSKVLSLHLSY